MFNRPRKDMREWEEADAATSIAGMKYALWLGLWHYDANTAWGEVLREARSIGYDGELHYGA